MMSEPEQQQQQQQQLMRDFKRSSKRFQTFARGAVALNRSVSALCSSFNELSALHAHLDQFNSVFSSLLEAVDLQSSTLRFTPLPSAASVGGSSHDLAAKLKPKPKAKAKPKAVSPPLNVQLPMQQQQPTQLHGHAAKRTGRIPSPKVRASGVSKAEAATALAAVPVKKKSRARPALKKLPAMYKSEAQRERLDKVLDALADHAEGLCLSEVVRRCGFSGIKTSEYLSLLTKLKHVERRKEKKGLTYTLSSPN